MSSGLFRDVGFIRAHPCGRPVHSGSLSSFRRTLVVVVFIRVRWVRWRAPWGLSGSFGFVRFIRARPWGHSVDSGVPSESLGSFGFVRLIKEVCRVHSGATLGS